MDALGNVWHVLALSPGGSIDFIYANRPPDEQAIARARERLAELQDACLLDPS